MVKPWTSLRWNTVRRHISGWLTRCASVSWQRTMNILNWRDSIFFRSVFRRKSTLSISNSRPSFQRLLSIARNAMRDFTGYLMDIVSLTRVTILRSGSGMNMASQPLCFSQTSIGIPGEAGMKYVTRISRAMDLEWSSSSRVLMARADGAAARLQE